MAESPGEGQVLTSLGMALTSGISAKDFYLYKILVSEQKDLGLAFILMERLNFQIAWATKEEEAIEVVVSYGQRQLGGTL